MNPGLPILIVTAASIGFFHTLTGPDHYVPFIVLSKARGWSLKKTGLLTVMCGLGHVLSSVVLGVIGIAAGILLSRLEMFESVRGNIAGWFLLAFGVGYTLWGVYKIVKPTSHTHDHGDRTSLTPWVLFIIFVFGPCEPLIPLLMYPAAEHSAWGVVLIAAVFSVVTIATMTAIVLAAWFGAGLVRLHALERYGHLIAGLMLFFSGFAIQALGL